MVSRCDFMDLVESHLTSLGVSFNPRDLMAFIDAQWPQIQDDPDPERWTETFVQTTRTTA
jgi:hypothetical protein